MELNFEVTELMPFPAFADPTLIFPTIYFDRQIYAATVPHTVFQDAVFCENTAQIILQMEDKECLELLSKEEFYVVLNTISPPKKAKKPADGCSFPELVLEPFQHVIPLKIDPFDGIMDNGKRHISLELSLAAYDGKSTLKCNVEGYIPDYQRFEEIELAIGGIRVGGNFSNLQPPFSRGLPPCEWDVHVELPCGREVVVSNGHLLLHDTQPPTSIASLDDLFAICEPKEAAFDFPCESSYLDVKCAEAGYKTLYALLGDAKNADKLCSTDMAQYNPKALSYCLKERGEPELLKALEILREAVEAALSSAVLDRNKRILDELANDPKKKIDTRGMIEAVKVTIEHATDFLAEETFANNYITLFLDQNEIQQIRSASDTPMNICVTPSLFWTDFLEADLEEFKCIGQFDFSQCLRHEIVSADIQLEITPAEAEMAEKTLEVSTKDKKKSGEKETGRKYCNILQSNYAVLSVALNFSKAGIIRTREYFVEEIRGKILHPEYLVQLPKTDIWKKINLTDQLTPSRESLSPRDQVLESLCREVENTYAEIGADDTNAALSDIAKTYVEELRDVVPWASSAEIYATIITTARTALKETENVQKSPAELVEFGNILLESNSVEDAERAMALFGTALARERADIGLYEHTEMLELCVLGSLKSAILSRNEELVERNICRAFAVSELDNANLFFNFELTVLIAAELMAMGENDELALLILHFYSGIYKFEVDDIIDIKQNLYLMIFVYVIFEKTENTLLDELKLLLSDYLREVNADQRFFSNVYVNDPDELIFLSLKLALIEWLISHHSIKFAQMLLANCAIEQFTTKQATDSIAIFSWTDSFMKPSEQAHSVFNLKHRPLEAPEVARQLVTKIALLEARIYYLNGQYNEVRHVLIKPHFLEKKPRTADNNPMKLLSYMQTDSKLEASFLDLFKAQYDHVPGMLAALALSCAHSHRIPQFFYYSGKLPQILVCAALQDLLPSKPLMSITTAMQAQSEVGRRTAVQLIANMEKKFQNPDRMIVSPETVADLQGMTFQLVLCNSRVAYEMSLQAIGYSNQRCFLTGYSGHLDEENLCINMLSDPIFAHTFSRLAVRYLPLFEMLSFAAPFIRPDSGEVEIASRIFEQIDDEFEALPYSGLEKVPYTTDFLAELELSSSQEIALLASSLLLPKIKCELENPQLLSTYGHLILRIGNVEQALQTFERALQLDSNDSGAWRGIALVMAHKIGEERDFGTENKMRDKILECLSRTLLQPQGEAAVAIAEALLDTSAERATMYAITASKLLEKEAYSPLTPIVAFEHMKYECDFEHSQQTQWYVRRLLAIAARACGRAEDVALHLHEALVGMGGAKPGRSVREIAERILLMTETSEAWREAGELQQAEKIMADGLL